MSSKKGDNIVCINNKDCTEHLTIGKVYTVLNTSPGYLCVLDDFITEHDLFQSRFRLATLLEKELSE